jgi:hypothetical protein
MLLDTCRMRQGYLIWWLGTTLMSQNIKIERMSRVYNSAFGETVNSMPQNRHSQAVGVQLTCLLVASFRICLKVDATLALMSSASLAVH